MKARQQSGIAAIELALIIAGAGFLMPVMLMFGYAMWQYSLVLGSLRQAARYMGSIPVAEMTNPGGGAAAADTARAMVYEAVTRAGLSPLPLIGNVQVMCDAVVCSGAPVKPAAVKVTLTFTLGSGLFGQYTGPWLAESMLVTASAATPYTN